jgi:hypothetical protein
VDSSTRRSPTAWSLATRCMVVIITGDRQPGFVALIV